jgi:saccharopine dehydrogenase-like NADP-dependent oxidoreductase
MKQQNKPTTINKIVKTIKKMKKKHELFHHEELRSLKPHCPTTKTQKTIHIQLLCNYLLGITTSVQLSP